MTQGRVGDVGTSKLSLALPGSQQEARRRLEREKAAQRRVTAMVAVVVAIFLACWIPFTIMFAGRTYRAYSPVLQAVHTFFQAGPMADTAVWLGQYAARLLAACLFVK